MAVNGYRRKVGGRGSEWLHENNVPGHSCTHKRKADVTACIKPVQGYTRPNPSMENRVGHEVPPVAEAQLKSY